MRSVTNSSRDSYFLLPPVLVLRNASVLPYAVIAPVRLWNAGESLAVIRLVIWVSADNSSIRSIASFARLKVNFFIIRRASYQDAHPRHPHIIRAHYRRCHKPSLLYWLRRGFR